MSFGEALLGLSIRTKTTVIVIIATALTLCMVEGMLTSHPIAVVRTTTSKFRSLSQTAVSLQCRRNVRTLGNRMPLLSSGYFISSPKYRSFHTTTTTTTTTARSVSPSSTQDVTQVNSEETVSSNDTNYRSILTDSSLDIEKQSDVDGTITATGKRTREKENDDNEERTKPFFSIYYNDVYEVILPPKHRFPMQKYGQVRRLVQQWINDLSQEGQDKVDCSFNVSPLATIDEVLTTHSEEYVKRYLDGNRTEQEQRNVGFPWSKAGVNRTLSSVGGTLAAACDVCEEWKKIKQAEQNRLMTNDDMSSSSFSSSHAFQLPPPWGAHIAGGTHHAFADRGEGFSVFSDIAVAANVVLQRYSDIIQKVLIVDLDVHQGNGNAVLFKNRFDVDTFSIQCEGNYFSTKQSSTLDIDLPIGCTDQTYLATLNHWLNYILKEQEQRRQRKNRNDGEEKRQQRHDDVEDSGYDMIFFQAGVDILAEDRLGRMSLSEQGVKRRNELVYEFAYQMNCPFVICMGGGYPRGDDWTPIIQSHANVYFQAHHFLFKHSRENSD